MKILLGDTRKLSWLKRIKEYGWGRMFAVAAPPTPYSGESWGFDNGAFKAWQDGKEWDEALFLKRLDRAICKGPPYLAVVPDIVAEGVKSLEFSEQWRERLPQEWPWFLAVQDGMEVDMVAPLVRNYAGLFLGGTNRFKATAQKWCDLAHKKGGLFHYGRAGTIPKVLHARDVGADSLDSTAPLWTEEKFQRFTEVVLYGHEQHRMSFMEMLI